MNTTLYKSLTPELQQKFRNVKVLLSDVDGVLTDGTIFMGNHIELKQFNVLDGLGLGIIKENGIHVGWISNRYSPATTARAQDLGIEFLFQEKGNKLQFAEEILSKTSLSWADTCYIGDDIVDLCIFRHTQLAISVANAHPMAKEISHYVTTKAGGKGAVREVCELILQAQDKWDNIEILKRGL